jgi:diguanylate cyclase (GGDEF)-like protein/PAS domain S-box-containing protein
MFEQTHFNRSMSLVKRCFSTVFTFITQNGRSEKSLEDNEELLQSLLQSMQDLVFVLDTDLVFQTYHQPDNEKLIFPPELFVGKHLEEVGLPEHVTDIAGKAIKETLSTGGVTHTEYWLDLSGGRLWFDMCVSLYRSRGKQIRGVVCVARDITGRKQLEEALEKRIMALTQPLDDVFHITFYDLFNLADIQRLQDDFARATGIGSIITTPAGTPLTGPSNFCRLCNEMICETAVGQANCRIFNATLGRPSGRGPIMQKCSDTGLLKASAAISVGGHHIANWLIGQVRDPDQSGDQIRNYARKIGADENAAVDAFYEAPVMTKARFEHVAHALYTMASHLSTSAYQNVQQARFIVEQKKARDKIAQLAHYDQLTGLANRTLFAERFEQASGHALRTNTKMALCVFDLDSLKAINDSHGHSLGNQLLCEVAKRLNDCVRASDTLCRIGGDEFVILFTDLQETNAVTALIQKTLACFEPQFNLGGTLLSVSASMGVAVFPEDGDEFLTLFARADAAMYFAKESGRNNVQFFRQEINDRVQHRLAVEKELRQALLDDELELHYQPIIQLPGKEIAGMEALVRWRHPQKGLIPPSQFIPVAEESNLIVSLGQWVLKAACRDMAAWRELGLPALPVSINVSARQLFEKDFANFVGQTLIDCALPPQQLELEVTENIFLESTDSVETVMNDLKNIGVGLVLDDFGTGYSSLSYLKRFRIDKLKIDRSFLEQVCHSQQDAALVATIIQMGQNLGMQVVSEGVETAGQMEFLIDQGCELAQGFFFSKPLPLAAVQEMLGRPEIYDLQLMGSQKVGRAGKSSIIRPSKPFGEARSLILRKI